MNIYNFDASAVTVYIPYEELQSQGLAAESITAEETAALLKKAVPEIDSYFSQIEIYPGSDEVIIFVFFSLRNPEFFRFYDIENVIAAAKNCNGELSELYFSDNSYVLAIYPRRGREAPVAIFEFGIWLNAPEGYEYYLKEHGTTLVSSEAVDYLSRVF